MFAAVPAVSIQNVESFTTRFTSEPEYARVLRHVVLQCLVRGEDATTHVAREAALVPLHMLLVVTQAGEAFLTLVAEICEVSRVILFV